MFKVNKPLLITGTPRSGTTWVGKVFSFSPSIRYVAEPFNPLISETYFGFKIPFWFLHINEKNEKEFHSILKNTFRLNTGIPNLINNITNAYDYRSKLGEINYYIKYNIGRARPLIKDPISLMSAEWLAKKFDMDVMVLIKHPAAFVQSAKRVNWGFSFYDIQSQPDLMEKLAPFKKTINQSNTKTGFSLENSILFWNIAHYLILEYKSKYPSWIFSRHEDLSLNPIDEFKILYKKFNINFDSNIEAKIIEMTGTKNTSNLNSDQVHILNRNSALTLNSWKDKLSSEELERIYEETYPFSKHFYSDEEWI